MRTARVVAVIISVVLSREARAQGLVPSYCLTSTVGVVVLSGVGSAAAGSVKGSREAAERDGGLNNQMLAAWLSTNATELAEDLAVGAGPALDDLLAAAEVQPTKRRGVIRRLRARRRVLLAAADATRPVEFAAAFRDAIEEATVVIVR